MTDPPKIEGPAEIRELIPRFLESQAEKDTPELQRRAWTSCVSSAVALLVERIEDGAAGLSGALDC